MFSWGGGFNYSQSGKHTTPKDLLLLVLTDMSSVRNLFRPCLGGRSCGMDAISEVESLESRYSERQDYLSGSTESRLAALEARVAALEAQAVSKARKPSALGRALTRFSTGFAVAQADTRRRSSELWGKAVRGVSDRRKRRRTILLVLLAMLVYVSGQVFTHWRTEAVLEKRFEKRTEVMEVKRRNFRKLAKQVALGIVTVQAVTMLGNAYLAHRGLKIAAVFQKNRIMEKIKNIQRTVRVAKTVTKPITLPVRVARSAVRALISPFRRKPAVVAPVAPAPPSGWRRWLKRPGEVPPARDADAASVADAAAVHSRRAG